VYVREGYTVWYSPPEYGDVVGFFNK